MLSLAGMLEAATRFVRRDRPALTAGDFLLGPAHSAPLQSEVLTLLASRTGAPVYDMAAALDKSRQVIDECLTRLVRLGLVERVKRRQTMGGKSFRAWFYRLTPSARQRIELANLDQEASS